MEHEYFQKFDVCVWIEQVYKFSKTIIRNVLLRSKHTLQVLFTITFDQKSRYSDVLAIPLKFSNFSLNNSLFGFLHSPR